MTTIHEKTAEKQRAMIPSRLEKGAAVLGRLWRENVRCLGQWDALCPCAAPNDFCIAKKRWLALVKEYNGGKWPHELSGNEAFLVLECMSIAAFEASGLTIVKALPGTRAAIRIGRGGTCPQTILDLEELYTSDPAGYAAGIDAVIKIQRIF